LQREPKYFVRHFKFFSGASANPCHLQASRYPWRKRPAIVRVTIVQDAAQLCAGDCCAGVAEQGTGSILVRELAGLATGQDRDHHDKRQRHEEEEDRFQGAEVAAQWIVRSVPSELRAHGAVEVVGLGRLLLAADRLDRGSPRALANRFGSRGVCA